MALESDEYTIIDSTIIIKWNVNRPIDLSLIDGQFTQLIFSNYIDTNECYKNSNKYIWHYSDTWTNSLFDHPIDFAINSRYCELKSIFFGENFNQIINFSNPTNLSNYTCQLNHLTFGFNFNQLIQLDNLNLLTHLTFGERFNQKIVFPESLPLTHLKFCADFNQFVIFPNSLVHLTLGVNFLQLVDFPNIKYLKINSDAGDDMIMENLLNNLPNSLETLIFGYYFNSVIDNLPSSIKFIELPRDYNKPISNIPLNLHFIKCNTKYRYKHLFRNFPKKVIYDDLSD